MRLLRAGGETVRLLEGRIAGGRLGCVNAGGGATTCGAETICGGALRGTRLPTGAIPGRFTPGLAALGPAGIRCPCRVGTGCATVWGLIKKVAPEPANMTMPTSKSSNPTPPCGCAFSSMITKLESSLPPAALFKSRRSSASAFRP